MCDMKNRNQSPSRKVMDTLSFKNKSGVGTKSSSMPVVDPMTKEIVINENSKEIIDATPQILLPNANHKGYQGSPVQLVDNMQWVDAKISNASEVVSSNKTTGNEKVAALAVSSLSLNDLRLGSVPIIQPANNRSGNNAQILTDTETYVNLSGTDIMTRASSFFSADRYLMSRIPLNQNFDVQASGTQGNFNPFPPIGNTYYGMSFDGTGGSQIGDNLLCTNIYFRIDNILDATTRATIYVAGMNFPIEVIPFDNTLEFCVTLWSGRPLRSSSLVSDGFGAQNYSISEDQRSFTGFYGDYSLTGNTYSPTVVFIAGPNAGADVQQIPFIIECENCTPDIQQNILSMEMAPAHSMLIRSTGPFA